MAPEWLEAVTKRKEGTEAFGAEQFARCATLLEGAIDLANASKDAAFDKRPFLAGCRAELAGAYGRLGRHAEAIATADAAIATYKPVGYQRPCALYPNEAIYYFAATYNRALSLSNLGRLDEAQRGFLDAQLLFYPVGPDGVPDIFQRPDNHLEVAPWQDLCRKQIEEIEAVKGRGKR